jgi:excisionase family DNA binding protein
MSETDSEFVTMQDAARLLGIGRMTLWRRVKEGALTVYESPSNRRVRLVKRSDVERLRMPVVVATAVATERGKRTRGH